MGILDMILQRKKETEAAGKADTASSPEDLETTLRKAEEERDRRYAQSEAEKKARQDKEQGKK